MDPLVFRKGDATSCLVVDKSWEEVVDMPYSFDDLLNRMELMSIAAEKVGLLRKETPFRSVKEAINEILMDPLLAPQIPNRENREATGIKADAFWDEIVGAGIFWEKMKDALARTYQMSESIKEHHILENASPLQKVKDTFNETVIAPMSGLVDEE